MPKFDTSFGCLSVEDGKIKDFSLKKDQPIPRNFDFSLIVKEFMKNLAESQPLVFMELYILLTNDDDFNKIAKEVYQSNIKEEEYPYEPMKELYYYNFPEHISRVNICSSISNNTAQFFRREDTISEIVISGYTTRRTNINFFPVIKKALIELINQDLQAFMLLRKKLEFDAIIFKLADDIRQQKLEAIVKLLTI